MSESLQSVLVLSASAEEKKLITHHLEKISMWWYEEQMVIPDLDGVQLAQVEEMLGEMKVSYATTPSTDGR